MVRYVLLFLTLSTAQPTTYSVFDGDSINISYSSEGLTLLKLNQGLKETVDFENFDSHITSDGKTIFLSNIERTKQPLCLIFNDGSTVGIIFEEIKNTPQVTHHIVLDKISMHPNKLAQAVLSGQRFSNFSERLLTDSYRTDNFIVKNQLQLKNSDVIVQKIIVTNIKNKIKNLNSFRQKSDVIGFASSKSAIRPGESCEIIFVRKS